MTSADKKRVTVASTDPCQHVKIDNLCIYLFHRFYFSESLGSWVVFVVTPVVERDQLTGDSQVTGQHTLFVNETPERGKGKNAQPPRSAEEQAISHMDYLSQLGLFPP